MFGLQPAKKASVSTRVLEIGFGKTGKTWDILNAGQGRTAVAELEGGVLEYKDVFDFDYTKCHSAEELARWLEGVRDNPEAFLANWKLLGRDGITKVWEEAVEKNTNSQGRVNFDKQADLKRPFTRIMNALKSLGNHGVSVVATGHAKKRWEVQGKSVAEKGIRAAFDPRLFEAFSLVLYRFTDEVEEGGGGSKRRYHAMVMESRLAHLGLDQGRVITNWDPKIHLRAVFNHQPVPGTPAAEGQGRVQQTTRDHIMRICETYGSKSNSGKLDDDLVREAVPFTRGEGTETEAEGVLIRLRAAESAIQGEEIGA